MSGLVRRAGPSRLWAALLLGLYAAAASGQEADALSRCRQANDDFDYEAVVTECALAAAAPGMSREQLIEVYRLLAVAHTALNNEEAAQVWFLRLLVLDPEHDLGPSVSPVYREAFRKAKEIFAAKGKVGLAKLVLDVPKEGPGPWPATVVIHDPLGRTGRAFLVVRAMQGPAELARAEVPLSETSAEGGRGFAGSVIDPAPADVDGDYRLQAVVELQSPGGQPIPLEPDPAPRSFPRAGAAVGSGLWLGLGAGGAAAGAALLVVGGGVAAVTICAVTECWGAGPAPESHVRVGPDL